MPNATPHTPYGMTECLLVTDVTLDGIRSAADEPDAGCASGHPIGSNRVLISALDADGRAAGAPSSRARRARRDRRLGAASEGSLRPAVAHGSRRGARDADPGRGCPGRALASHRRRRASRRARPPVGGGRMPHVIVTSTGPIAPVGAEQDVGAGAGRAPRRRRRHRPHGLRQAVAVVETVHRHARPGLADPELGAAVRAEHEPPAGRGARGSASPHRHPAQLEDRPDPPLALGRADARRRKAGRAVIVLVTGASGSSAAPWRPNSSPPATRCAPCSGDPRGWTARPTCSARSRDPADVARAIDGARAWSISPRRSRSRGRRTSSEP